MMHTTEAGGTAGNEIQRIPRAKLFHPPPEVMRVEKAAFGFYMQASVSQCWGWKKIIDASVGEARRGNSIVRRAKHFSSSSWRIKPIPIERLRLIMRADASNQNATKSRAQAGSVIAATDDGAIRNDLSP